VRQARGISGGRLTEFQKRVKDPEWLADYPAALAKIPNSAFLRGRNERGWIPDIDWFLKPDTVTRILEGKYDDAGPGRKRRWLWPDNDAPDPKRGGRRTGSEHMRRVATALARLTPPAGMHWIDPDRLGLPVKGDAVDWVAKAKAAGVSEPAALMDRLDQEVLATAMPIRASAPLRQHYADIASGRLSMIPWPWPLLQDGTQALQPGHLTALCGEPGAGKSFLLVECLWHWLTHGHRPTCLMLELAAEFHAKRLHAMLAEEPRLLNMDWVRDNGSHAQRLYDMHAADLDRFWRIMDTVPRGAAVTAATVLHWLRRRCLSDARVLGVDPFTAIADDVPWVTDVQFLLAAQQIAEEYRAWILLTIHPDRGGNKMARSEGLRRFVDTVFWLTKPESSRSASVLTPSRGKVWETFNRSLRVTKARLASGVGGELAYEFSAEGLRFAELGVVVANCRGEAEA
jgi:hypothetical protein